MPITRSEHRKPFRNSLPHHMRPPQSEQGLKNKKKGRNRRKNQWTDSDFVLFGVEGEKETMIETVKENVEKDASPVREVKHSFNLAGQLLQLMPCEIFMNIFTFLTVKDVNPVWLLVSSSISETLLGGKMHETVCYDDIDLNSTVNHRYGQEWYRMITFLTMRQDLDQLCESIINRSTFVKTPNDLTREFKKAKQLWEKTDTTTKIIQPHVSSINLKELRRVNIEIEGNAEWICYWNALSHDQKFIQRDLNKQFNRLVQNEAGLESFSKIKGKMFKLIGKMNELFPNWLTVHNQQSLGHNFDAMQMAIDRNQNLTRLAHIIEQLKRVGIPVFPTNQSDVENFEYHIKEETMKILFPKRAPTFKKRKERDWKPILRRYIIDGKHNKQVKHLLKEIDFKYCTSFRKFTRFQRNFRRSGKLLESIINVYDYEKDFKQPIYNLIDLLKNLNEGARWKILFQKDYARGQIQKRTAVFKALINKKNDFMSFFQHIIYLYRKLHEASNYKLMSHVPIPMWMRRVDPPSVKICRGQIMKKKQEENKEPMYLGSYFNFKDDEFLDVFTEFMMKEWLEFCHKKLSKRYNSKVKCDMAYDLFMEGYRSGTMPFTTYCLLDRMDLVDKYVKWGVVGGQKDITDETITSTISKLRIRHNGRFIFDPQLIVEKTEEDEDDDQDDYDEDSDEKERDPSPPLFNSPAIRGGFSGRGLSHLRGRGRGRGRGGY